MQTDVPEKISERITVLRYPLAALVVMLHASWGTTNAEFVQYNLNENPFTLVQWFVQAIGCGAVPLFFAISAYLQYKKNDSYGVLLKKKAKSLLFPYMVWTCLVILFYWLAAKLPFMHNYFAAKPDYYVMGWSALDWIKAFVGWGTESGHPVGGPLWFVRDLLFFVLLTPFVRFFMNRFPHSFLLALSVLYFYGFQLYFIGTDALFYCVLGAYFAKIDESLDAYINIPWFENIVVAAFAYFSMKITGGRNEIYVFTVTLSLWNLSRYMLINEKVHCVLQKLAPHSFFLFAIHGTMMLVAKSILSRAFTLQGINFLIVWLLCIILVLGGGTIISLFVQHVMPHIWRVLNGGR